MSDFQVKPKFYPLKPQKPEDFKKAVAWFGGRELIASLKGIIMYAIYGENMDPRSWMKANIYPNVEEKVRYQKEDKERNQVKQEIQQATEKTDDYKMSNAVVDTVAAENFKKSETYQAEIINKVNEEWKRKIFDYWEWKRTHFGFWEKYLENADFWKKLKDNKPIDEFWFDYIADSGDGQMGVFNVGCMCLSDLWLESEDVGSEIEFAPPKDKDFDKRTLLPRGYFLFVGGDTAYHSANYATLFERFQTPFRWAFTSVRKFLSEKYDIKLKLEETFFWCEGEKKKILETGLKNPTEKWDGTISGEDQGNEYWDTEPPRQFFGIPANHDYYDSVDGFNRQFRRSPFEDIKENMIYKGSKGRLFLQIPTFSREQEASYIAIHLPFDWWLFGIDSENEKLDFRQEVFFSQIMEKTPKKLILATPEPTTVFGKKSIPAEKTTKYLKAITGLLGYEQPFLTDGKFEKLPSAADNNGDAENNSEKTNTPEGFCRLDLSGDVHHYARYWGEDTRKFKDGKFASDNYASLVSGGGGAFFDTTSTLIGNALDENGEILRDEKGKKGHGEIPPQAIYPLPDESINRTADRIFDLWNIKKGGYIQYAGVLFAVVVFFLLTQYSTISYSFNHFSDSFKLGEFSQIISAFVKSFEEIGINLICLILLITIGLTIWTMIELNKLIGKIKEKNLDEKINEATEGELMRLARIKNIIKAAIPFFVAVIVYGVFLFIGLNLNYSLKNCSSAANHFSCSLFGEIQGIKKNLFLLLHFILAGLVIWLSFDYTNWLALRFKIARRSAHKTFTEKMEDPNESADKFLREEFDDSSNWFLKSLGNSSNFFFKSLRKLIGLALRFFGKRSREYSYEYFPANALVILGFIVLILGILIFGDVNFGKVLADVLLLLVLVGGFCGLIYLAAGTGAAYLDKGGKKLFFWLGAWHGILQLLTPFVLFYYAPWWLVIVIFILVIALNGFSKAGYRINEFLPENMSGNKGKWKKSVRNLANFRVGAWLMKRRKPRLLTFWWIAYGLIILLSPFVFRSLNNKPVVSLNETVHSLSGRIAESGNYRVTQPIINYSDTRFSWLLLKSDWIYIALALLIIGFIGYRMSRVWFSWYLGVSVLFNGHNNEAGGLARIEDFKHILRIRVRDNDLTVYVIGMNNAQPNLDESLKLKLVDKFTLNCFKQPEKAKG